jgi:hypothetical protein
MWRLSFILFAMIFFAAAPAGAQSYEFSVEHEHTWRSCRGKLVITPEQIEYQTEHQEHARVWRYNELQQIKIESPQKLELASYEDQKWRLGLDRVFKFNLLAGEVTPASSSLLLERSARPLVTSVLPASEDKPTFEAPVKHLHRLGGCLGTLKIYPDRVVYESQEMPSDSRYWRYGEIQQVSQSERFRFEVVSFESKFGGPKAYNFQLREELPATAYDYVWGRVYPSKLRRDANLAQPLINSRPTAQQ